jgi:hypothetical protein
MSDQTSRRGLQRRCTGVRRELRVGTEPPTGSEYASKSAGGEEVYPTQPGQGLKLGTNQTLDSRRQCCGLVHGELKALSQPADGRCAFHLQWVIGRRNVGMQGGQAGPGLQSREAKGVLRIDLHEQAMNLIPEPCCVEDGLVAFIREQAQNDRVVVSGHRR